MNNLKNFSTHLTMLMLGALIFLGSCTQPTSDNAQKTTDTTATINTQTVPIAPIAIVTVTPTDVEQTTETPTIGQLTDKVTNLANLFLALVTFLGTQLWKWHDPNEKVQNTLKAVCITLSVIVVLACYGVTSLGLFGVGSGVMTLVAIWKALSKQA